MNTTTYPGATPIETAASNPLGTLSAVSWPAIFGGAAAAASLSLILLVLGTGFGFSSVSPWTGRGADATTFGVATILWISFTQIVASAAGGYIAGRLRIRWVGVHDDEVYFRDTVHGFLAWSIATLVTAAMLASAVGSALSAGANVAGSIAGTAATGGVAAGAAATGNKSEGTNGASGTSYFVDSLFRKAPSDVAAPSTNDVTGNAAVNPQPQLAEVGRIMVQSIQAGAVSPEDTRYVGQLVAQRTGLSQTDAEKRVTDTFNRAKSALDDAAAKAKEAADKARKASAYAALWLFVSLLAGAFVASLAATFGGRGRDLY